jgi:hypothetical protein
MAKAQFISRVIPGLNIQSMLSIIERISGARMQTISILKDGTIRSLGGSICLSMVVQEYA